MPRKNSQIRIISGKLGGRLIDTPKTDKTHPMGDRERAAIFNRLRGDISGKIILDAFAGSGAIGLEALSLDAAEVDFLENNRKAAKTIHDNIEKFKLGDKAKIVRKMRDEYDIIFIVRVRCAGEDFQSIRKSVYDILRKQQLIVKKDE